MEAGNSGNGNMFEIVAKNDLRITGFSIHTSETKPVECKVFTREGAYDVSSNENDWDLVQTVTVPGKGEGVLTPLGLLPNAIEVSATNRHAFYITLTGGDRVKYTNVQALDVVFKDNNDISFYTGMGVSYPFGSFGSWEKRVWNGEILYEIA
jgi:hypothetical protein